MMVVGFIIQGWRSPFFRILHVTTTISVSQIDEQQKKRSSRVISHVQSKVEHNKIPWSWQGPRRS